MTWNRWSLAIVAAMFVLAGVCFPFMADSLPIHWTDGVADSYAGKTRALFFLPIMTAVLYSVAWLITRHHEEGAIGRMVFGLAVVGLLTQVAMLVAQAGAGIQVDAVVVGIVLVFGYRVTGPVLLSEMRPNGCGRRKVATVQIGRLGSAWRSPRCLRAAMHPA